MSTDVLPVAAGLYEQAGGVTHLVGTRCTGCGTHYFPTSLSCRNPACATKVVERALLGSRGVLYSYTRQAYQPPALFRMDDWEPYLIGLVELPEGLRVMGMLTGVSPEEVHIDMPVELTTLVLHRDADGREVATYAYRPAGDA